MRRHAKLMVLAVAFATVLLIGASTLTFHLALDVFGDGSGGHCGGA